MTALAYAFSFLPTAGAAAASVKKRRSSIVYASSSWAMDSWRSKPALHIPTYPNQEELESVLESLAIYPPLVFTEEARKLEDKLADAAVGKAFLLQGGDCAESSMMFKVIHIRDTFNVLMQMAVILAFRARMPIIKVGRMAGPGSEPFQTKDDVKLSDSFKDEARALDPKKLLQDYSQSAGTLNLLRAFARDGYASIHGVTQWNLDFVQDSEQGDRYMELAKRVDDAIKFMVAVGLPVDDPIMTMTKFWISHECLQLPYEQALTRHDSTSGQYYDCSAHMLWVGERTCQLDGAHVEFLRGLANPLGIKVSDKMDPSELIKLCEILNPHNKPGKLTIVTSMGAANMRVKFSHLIRAVKHAELIVTWVSDPMQGNIMKAPRGAKTCSFDEITVSFYVIDAGA